MSRTSMLVIMLLGLLLASIVDHNSLTADRNHWEDCARAHSTSAECTD